MSHLYHQLAAVYEAMYQTFINYEEEYVLYSTILKKYKKTKVVEIGCGTGNLVPYFQKAGFEYLGVDLSQEMIQLAKDKVPTGAFRQGDMRQFQLREPTESVLITARTISYLVTNQDLITTFSTIAKNLKLGGILCFDFIDANQFMHIVEESDEIIHRATYKGIHYVRKSKWTNHLEHCMGFKWDSIYYQKEGEKLIELGRDNSYVRAFTRDELTLFLELQGFEILEMIARATYAFPTYVLVARKK